MDNRPSEGVYDLEIEGATYDRDNGQFECRMKEGGSGRELHSKSVTVTGLCLGLLLLISHSMVNVVIFGYCDTIEVWQ